MRNPWTRDEVATLREVYADRKLHGVTFPPELLEKHRLAGCHVKASRLGLTSKRTPKRMFVEQFPETDKAYFAGLFDGEGCINKMKPSGLYRLTISSTDWCVIQWLLERFSFTGYYENRRPKSPNRKHAWAWQAQSQNDCLDILEGVLSYLIIKKEQARAAIRDIKLNA